MPNLAQFPSPPGNLNQVVATITGPTDYTSVGVASPPTGGIVVKASDLGLTTIQWADGGASDDGQYGLTPIFDNNPAADVSQVRFQVNVLNTGAQAALHTNLSARTFRIYAFGL